MGVSSSKLCRMTLGGRGCRRLLLRGTSAADAPLMTTPKGYVPICVGVDNEDTRRFFVHTTALGDAKFLEFLGKSAEEYGFCNEGILRIPYEAQEFEDWILKRANPKVKVKTF